jgi:DNA invertase Pin-like site-specific DNA recombinase
MPSLSKSQFVAYYRVSTDKQGRSGLGLEAQREAVAEFIRLHNGELLGEFEEVESGRKVETERPALANALQACRAYRAKLLVAKLDRLARNAAFLHRLRESGIRFTCCDMPDANELTVGILALVAEDEARRISERTKAALAAAKRRGTVLGGYRGGSSDHLAASNVKAVQVRKAKSANHARNVWPYVAPLVQEGRSLGAIARELTRVGRVKTPRGGANWTATAVQRVVERNTTSTP